MKGSTSILFTRSGWAVHQLVLCSHAAARPSESQQPRRPGSDPASRHDRLTDLVYLANLALYIQAFLDDRQFDADIATYTNIVQGEFPVLQGRGIDDRRWVYFLSKRWLYRWPLSTAMRMRWRTTMTGE